MTLVDVPGECLFRLFSRVYLGSGSVRLVQALSRVIGYLHSHNVQQGITIIYPGSPRARCIVVHDLERRVTRCLLIASSTRLGRTLSLQTTSPSFMHVCRTKAPSRTTTLTMRLMHANRTRILVGKLVGASGLLHTILGGKRKLLPRKKILDRITITRMPLCRGLLFFSSTTMVPHPALRRCHSVVTGSLTLYHALKYRRPQITLVRYARGVGRGFPRALDCIRLGGRTRRNHFKGIFVSKPVSTGATYSGRDKRVGKLSSPIMNGTSVLVFPGVRTNGAFCGALSLFNSTGVTNVLANAVTPMMIPSQDSSKGSGCCDLMLTYLTKAQGRWG